MKIDNDLQGILDIQLKVCYCQDDARMGRNKGEGWKSIRRRFHQHILNQLSLELDKKETDTFMKGQSRVILRVITGKCAEVGKNRKET